MSLPAQTARGEPTRLAGLVASVLGLGLVALSVHQWQRRPTPGQPVEMPAMLARLDRVGPIRALRLGLALSSLNPKEDRTNKPALGVTSG